ncbi:MAG: hypothetical protein GY832_10255 [Chloroflexi bacterium]|nr:hypothetical protein [Chloroflexota bacterium]
MTTTQGLIGRILRGVLWMLMSITSYVVALLVFPVAFFVVAWLLELTVRTTLAPGPFLPLCVACIISAITFAITSSVMQWLVIMDQVSVKWILASTAGYIMGTAFILATLFLVYNVLPDTLVKITTVAEDSALSAVILVGPIIVGIGTVAGIIVGTGQWPVLSMRFSQAGWVLSNAIGWAVGLGIVGVTDIAVFHYLASLTYGEGQEWALALVYIYFVMLPLTIIPPGPVIGAITGFTLVRLLGRRITHATPDLAVGNDFNCSEPETVTNNDGHTPGPPSR